MMNRRLLYGILILTLLLLMMISLSIGAVRIPLKEVFYIVMKKIGIGSSYRINAQHEAVFFIIRLPRVLMAVLVGAGLAISGAAIQGIFRNPLAEPGLVGISSGATLLAVAVIFFEITFAVQFSSLLGYYILSLAAFLGAAGAAFFVYRLSASKGKANVTTMLLVGIAVNALTMAFTGLMSSLATDQQLRNISFWNLGSLGGASWQTIACLFPFVLIPLIVLPQMSKSLNTFALGEVQAGHLGMRVNRTKRQVIILATMAVGASVAVSGTILFVGLLVPHIIRLLVGADHRVVIPASALLGALILSGADLVARTLIAPAELPIGVITAFLGTPVFLYILLRDKKKFSA